MSFKRQVKYGVFSHKDAAVHLSNEEYLQLVSLMSKIEEKRMQSGKAPISAVVIDQNTLGKEAYEAGFKIVETAVTAKLQRACTHPEWKTDYAIMGGFDVHTCTKCGYTETN
ncbi:hypothetical protein CHLORIS_132 [Vibrio phage Chloris]|uniref:Uncharacterized protein n=2 Tax=Thalassavirus TaxID=2948922 RepID=A0A4Y6E9G4_9CAUD|nr:hypothetical protein KNU58_gp157 [Vibrio phage Brizo]YP_010114287.1 hypothetical protein KNV71_gp179 [Vibrio phage Gary]QQO89752.1 hypothetical protein GRLPWR_137 [Vibrio phage GRLPWR]WBF69484.1 hypothetical protein IW18_134 [Vibrio phage IW18]WBU76542.1 hypothetical protein CHLORIS_132 [Vibrio phage Chloris]QDF14526.1 hypothetical protein BRIZO_128 [Vibrio phage Brizo]QQV88221.1 hypothetical protein GARY_139 [Vibrio phage Gary]